MRALLAGLLLLCSCLESPEDDSDDDDSDDDVVVELALAGGRHDLPPAASGATALELDAIASMFAPPAGWTYNLYRDVSVAIRSSCLPGSCAPNGRRVLAWPSAAGQRITGQTSGGAAVFRWQWFPGDLDPRTGQPYPSWVPIFPYFAVQFFWGCADTPGGGPVNDYAPCHGGPNQMWTTSGVSTYGAPYNTSGRNIDGYLSRPCWDLPANASPSLSTVPCHDGPNQQFQFNYLSCSAQGEACSTDHDCCYWASGGCNTSSGTCQI